LCKRLESKLFDTHTTYSAILSDIEAL